MNDDPLPLHSHYFVTVQFTLHKDRGPYVYPLLRHCFWIAETLVKKTMVTDTGSVGDPDPQDPHVFGPPGSGSNSQRYGSGSFPFFIKVLS